MGNDDPLGLTQAQRAAAAATAAATDAAPELIRIAADPSRAHIVERNRYCPARLPCLGLPAVGVEVPVVNTSTGETVGQVRGVWCPECRTMSADQPRASA